jgi:acylphosphatase
MDEPARDPVRLEAVVRGRVQGVGFRYFVAERALERGIVGWVANELDGSVACVVEGPRPELESFLVELGRGPLGARVDGVRTSWGPAAGGFDHFGIRSGAHRGD